MMTNRPLSFPTTWHRTDRFFLTSLQSHMGPSFPAVICCVVILYPSSYHASEMPHFQGNCSGLSVSSVNSGCPHNSYSQTVFPGSSRDWLLHKGWEQAVRVTAEQVRDQDLRGKSTAPRCLSKESRMCPMMVRTRFFPALS